MRLIEPFVCSYSIYLLPGRLKEKLLRRPYNAIIDIVCNMYAVNSNLFVADTCFINDIMVFPF